MSNSIVSFAAMCIGQTFKRLLSNSTINRRVVEVVQVCLIVLSSYIPLWAGHITWSISQVTNIAPGPEVGNGAYSPDINDDGEIVYTLDSYMDSQNRSQIHSTVRGQLTFDTEWSYAMRRRINNLGEVIFDGAPINRPDCSLKNEDLEIRDCNGQIFRLDGTRVDSSSNFWAANNLDHNDKGEVIGLGLGSPNGLYSSTRGFLHKTHLSGGIGISNSGAIAMSGITESLISGLPTGAANFSINDLDEVVFNARNSILFWDGVELHTVAEGSHAGEPRLNNHRSIVFQKSDQNGVNQIFLATAKNIPEPSGLFLLVLAVGCLSAAGNRRYRS